MKIQDYIQNYFERDLRKINFHKPNDVILSNPERFRLDENTIFFGGKDWSNFENDIKGVNPEYLEFFILSLFSIVVIDLTMFSHFRSSYQEFRKFTNYPKFGWSGFGPHYENPKIILFKPENLKIIDTSMIIGFLDDYIDFFISEGTNFFKDKMPDITTQDFISKLLIDNDFKLSNEDKGTLFEEIFNKLKESVSE